jgi:hypothetical protein
MDSGFCQGDDNKRADIGECGSPVEIAACDIYFAKMKETATLR